MGQVAIIESTGLMRIRIQRLLQEIGVKSSEVSPSKFQKGQRFVYSFEDTDLILLDIDNQDIDVLEVIGMLKKEPLTAMIPIMALGGSGDIKNLKAVIAKGCSDFMMKPFDNATFLRKIVKWLPNHTSQKDGEPPKEHISQRDMNSIKLVWSDDFKIGVEEIDREHKAIIDRFHQLYLLMREGKGHAYYGELIAFLQQYINEHFEHEEAYQVSIGYDQLKQHKEKHLNFKNQVLEIITTHENKEITNMDLIQISIFIKEWLIHHVLMEDGRIGEFVRGKRE